MTDVFDVVREANPIKDVDRYAEVVAGLGGQLHDISWRDEMISDKPRVVSLEEEPLERRSKGWWLAAAVFVLVVLGGLGLALVASDGNGDIAEVPAPTTLLTQAPATTAEATLSPLETVELFLERWVVGDVAGAETLINPEATDRCYECEDTTVFRWADSKNRLTDISTVATAYASGPGANYSCSETDSLVTCSMSYETLFVNDPAVNGVEWTDIFTVTDGLITHFDLGVYSTHPDFALSLPQGIDQYGSWLAAEYPVEYEDLFFFGTMLLNDLEQIEAHREFIAEWAEGR